MHDLFRSAAVLKSTAAACLVCLLPCGLAAQTAPAPATGTRGTTSGSFTDKTGVKHRWQVNDAHALLWDETPYLPVGGTFVPRSLNGDGNDESAWQQDKLALDAIKAKGLHDLILWPTRSLPDVAPAALQRVMDYCDANGIQYGLAFGPGLDAPLTGMVIKPAAYRYDSRDSLTAQWTVANADSALFILVDATDKENKILRSGGVFIKDPQVTVPIDLPANSSHGVALLYPHKQIAAQGNGSLPDVWNAFDGYRDRLLTFLSKIKFGPNFRFFLDPLARQLGLGGESDYLIPDSNGFLLEYEAFLLRRYPRIDDLKQSWGLTEGDFKTHRDLARLVPLWANDRGIPYCFDTTTGKTYRILDARQSHWWDDFLQARRESLLYTMNALAVLLKHEVADAPVVYTWTQTDPMFLNTNATGGYDGLSVVAPANDPSGLGRVLGPAYSEAEQAARPLWCIASQIPGESHVAAARPQVRTTALDGKETAAALPYPSRNALFYDLDLLRRVGYKGFFADALQSGDTAAAKTSWLAAPETLDWLREYRVRVEGEPKAARYAPNVLFFPQQAPGPAHIGFVPGDPGTLWLNAFAPGDTLDLWPCYRGYILKQGDRDKQVVLLSLQGSHKTRIGVPNAKGVRIHTADGASVPFKLIDKTTLEVTLDERPLIFDTGGEHLFPQDAAVETMKQLYVLYSQAAAAKVPAVEQERSALEHAGFSLKQKDYETAYNLARAALDELTYLAAPYIWIEGEMPNREQNTFSEIAANVEASNQQYLRLSTPNAPGRFGYAARYLFDVPSDGRYNLWIAGTVPGPNTSPMKWRINTEPEQDPANSKPQGPLYLNERFGWILLGSAQLRRGPQQSLTIYVTDRAQLSNDYVFGIDALLLTQNAFAPNGTVRPLPVDWSTVRAFKKGKQDDGFGF